MRLEMDRDVQVIAEIMQDTLPAARLVSVAAALHSIAPLLWGHHEVEAVRLLTLSAGDLHMQSDATGFDPVQYCAGDDFEAAVDAPV